MKAIKFFIFMLHVQACILVGAMDHVIVPNYLYGEWQTTSLQYRSCSREIHKELFCPLRERLIKSRHVKTIYACDAPDSIEQVQVLVITNHALKHGTELPTSLHATRMSQGATKNMRKFLSAYVQLSKLYRWGFITCDNTAAIILTEQAQLIASADAKVTLRRLCKKAKLKCTNIS